MNIIQKQFWLSYLFNIVIEQTKKQRVGQALGYSNNDAIHPATARKFC